MKVTKIGLKLICLLFLSLMLVGRSFAEIDPETLIGAWLFEETKGDTAKDSSGNGNNGTLEKNPKSVEGVFGKALEFDGSNGVVIDNPDNFEFLEWTYVLWFRAASGGDWPNLIGRQFANTWGWTIHLDPAGATFRIRIDTDGGINQVLTAPKTVRDEEWHHGAITHDDKNKALEIYIDGVKTDITYNGDYKNSGGFLKIGLAAVGAVNFTNGAIDEVGIFNVLIEEDDILNIMENVLEEAVKLLDVSPSGRLSTTWGRIRDNN